MNFEGQWTVYRTRFLVRARQLAESLVFTDALGREQSGEPGDYVVESNDGVMRITTQALFEDIYVPLAPALLLPPAPSIENSVAQTRHLPHGPAPIIARPASRASPEIRSYPSA